ncbi:MULTISPECIES: AMP-binding protein [Thermomonosporaceae]|uniref:AMP-binding protein n=1 Tax=Thermomonosporaceae TaxID=2012 RepID=UPI00255A835B|nr:MULTISPECIES: AMP-binding protein [Thermomonosporaceae]MDL4775345.1 AMP-binding protein [Actinomadura xylanilytica]
MTAPWSLFGRFAAAAERHADASALEIGGEAWSYRDLDRAAARLAGLLVERHGGTPPRRMGVLCGRTFLAYAGYLAGLRLGATIVPLNPAVPAERNRLVAEATGLDLILADGSSCGGARTGHLGAVASATGATVVALPGVPPTGDEGPPPSPAARADVVYTLFTSGSTGRPKGVPVTHANVDAFLDSSAACWPIGPGDRLSLTFDLTFDPSVFVLFHGWGSGATVVVPAGNEALRPSVHVNRRRITHWFSVPSAVTFALRARDLRPGSMPGLRRTLFGGDRLTAEQAAAWADAAPGSVIENTYGPTEATVFCMTYRLPDDRRLWPRTSNGTVPIGSPLPTVEHLVLDAAGRPADEGELILRGPQRFPGYLDPGDDPGRFLRREAGPRPSRAPAPSDPECWYRTGDRVRLEDGRIVHLGRTDDQLKVRGYRVEPGEIEAVLRRHPQVRDAVVLGTADQGLAAAYTGRPVPARDLVELVRGALPAYMLPTRFRYRRTLPVNGNGKVDRGRLAAELEQPPDGREAHP